MKKQITIFLKQVVLIAIAILSFISIPLQFIDFILSGKNRILKQLENRFFTIQFQITDLKRKL
ncbi:MAG: hypothetical protein K2P85_01855 [Flavobacteriaceae bacterium]|nr:hypothetical protein [Flavobacteriaceae bacterium]